MRFHVNALPAALLFAGLLLLAVDARLGVAAIAAGAIVDWLSFALPLGLGRGRDRRT
jgi:hypothetical protein